MEGIAPAPAYGAEDIKLIIGGPGLILTVSVDSLETFTETGEIPRDLRLFSRFISDEALELARQNLRRPIAMTVQQVDNLGYSTLGEDILHNVGKVVQLEPGINGFSALRGAVINAAAQAGPDGWTALDVLRQFPSQSIDIQVKDLLELGKTLDVYFRYNRAALAAIQTRAQAEEQTTVDIRFDDLTQPGAYAFERQALTLTNSAVRQTNQGIQTRYTFSVDAYVPQSLTAPAPVVIISHGFGDVKDSFSFIAEHLASHGYVVVLPVHVGSDLSVRQSFLEGIVDTILSPSEFVSRPEEISFLIDEMERWVATTEEGAALVNPDQIAILGDSLGGSTALSIAGANISFAYLDEACNPEQVILNFSRYVQCQARFLPPQDRQLGDPRIKAAIASHPLGGSLYGPAGMSQLDIPLLMVSGSDDVVAPVVTEQIYPFIWTQSDHKYLAMLTRGTHFTAKPGREGAGGFFASIAGDHRDIGSRYFKALSLAFLNTHLRDDSSYMPYLNARYGHWLSADQPLKIDLIRSLTADDLTTAYDRRPPFPIFPDVESTTASTAFSSDPVLSQIQQTGTLKIALRQDAAPLGYVNQELQWVGYCRDFAADLRERLAQEFGQRIAIDLVEIESSLGDRFSLVQDGIAHMECGPNTIRQDVEGIVFSNPLMVTGPQFLVHQAGGDRVNPNIPLDDVRIAVLSDTTTEQFVLDTYPEAEVIPFDTITGRRDSIQALVDGQVDAVASDGVLAISEVTRQGREATDFALVPERPLRCEFYGLILPDSEPDWQAFINDFIADTHNARLPKHLSAELLQEQLSLLEFCL